MECGRSEQEAGTEPSGVEEVSGRVGAGELHRTVNRVREEQEENAPAQQIERGNAPPPSDEETERDDEHADVHRGDRERRCAREETEVAGEIRSH